MDKNSELDCYLYYMWNRWDEDECKAIFGERLGDHIWNKWCNECYNCGHSSAPASFYAELSSDNCRKIVKRAVEYYNPKES